MKPEETREELHTEKPDGSAIIAGIISQAEQEAEQIVSSAQRSAAGRKAAMKKQRERELEAAGDEAQRRKEELLSSAQAGRNIELKRRALIIRERLSSMVIRQASSEASAMIGTPAYREILEELLSEAALGIRTDSAVVSASAGELEQLDQELLDRASERVRELSGRMISLKLSDRQPLSGQGVLLTSEDGSVAYSNQIPVRIQRMQSEIRHLVHSQLFAGSENTTEMS